jgi:hypothetical protein
MRANPADREETVRYLLGTLTGPELERFEVRFFGHAEALDEVAAVENRLIDQYLRGELSFAEREQFERAYLFSPERARRVGFARAFQQFLAQERPDIPRAHPGSSTKGRFETRSQVLLVAAALTLIAVGSLFVIESLRSRRELRSAIQENARLKSREGSLRAENARLREDARWSKAELEREKSAPAQSHVGRPKRPEPLVASLVLRGDLTRGEAAGQSVEIGPRTDLLRLSVLVAASSHRSFEAIVQTPENVEVVRRQFLEARATPSGRTVTLEIPADRLPGGDYIVMLRGDSPDGRKKTVGEYSFRLIRR